MMTDGLTPAHLEKMAADAVTEAKRRIRWRQSLSLGDGMSVHELLDWLNAPAGAPAADAPVADHVRWVYQAKRAFAGVGPGSARAWALDALYRLGQRADEMTADPAMLGFGEIRARLLDELAAEEGGPFVSFDDGQTWRSGDRVIDRPPTLSPRINVQYNEQSIPEAPVSHSPAATPRPAMEAKARAASPRPALQDQEIDQEAAPGVAVDDPARTPPASGEGMDDEVRREIELAAAHSEEVAALLGDFD